MKLLERINDWIGRAVAWLTLVMVLLMLAIVIGRYLFNAGSIAMQEAVVYLHAMVFMLGAGYALNQDQHVRVDIFYRRFTQRGKDWVDLLGSVLLLLPVCVYLIDASADYVQTSWRIREGSPEAGGLPLVYLLKTLIPAAAALLALQGIVIAIRCSDRLFFGMKPGD